jgi:putative restriction endonuclease
MANMNISEFFVNMLGANLANPRWSWGAFNPNTNQLFLRVWKDQLKSVNGIERISIIRTAWKGTSAGFEERKRHIQVLRNGAEGYGVLCVAKDLGATGARRISKFDGDTLLRFGKLIDSAGRVYARVIGRVAVGDLTRIRTAHSSLAPDIKTILNSREDVTTKVALINARLGQGEFRARVLSKWGSQCCVTGSITLDAVRASHIKPWRDSKNKERLDPSNGLPLIATLDALFDARLITFSSEGKLLVSKRLASPEDRILGLAGLHLLKRPDAQTCKYLEHHRVNFFTLEADLAKH